MLPDQDFNRGILTKVAHRPWPMPTSPWLMTQTWHDLLFAHWPTSVRKLRDLVPPEFELDLFDGEAWIGVVPFHMTNVAPRGVPSMPWISEFPELNVRTYVRVADRPGVYFFSLDAGSAIAVQAARTLLNLPYYTADMAVDVDNARVRYSSRRTGDSSEAAFTATCQPVSPVVEPEPGSLEYFLTERYCLYNRSRVHGPYHLQIHHPRWPLQRAEAAIDVNTMAEAAGLTLAHTAPVLHFSKRQDMVAWGPVSLTS